MYYSLLDILACPVCKHELTILCPEEITKPTSMQLGSPKRMCPIGAVVGPLPQHLPHSKLRELLSSYAVTSVIEEINFRYINDAVLVCLQCQRWFPVRVGLPELLPDHLRDWENDQKWLVSHRDRFEEVGLKEVFSVLSQYINLINKDTSDKGAKYKIAEMSVTKRNLQEGFFGPANVTPFFPLTPKFSLDLILRFTTTVQHLDCGVNSLVLDLGVGYAWTTEWLVRLGYRAIGIDICRDYLLAGLPRMSNYLPHLVVADVENLPLLSDSFDAVLSFDSFHHIPNRNQAMLELDRIMRAGTKIALVEPGKEHEHSPISIAVMQQHGILEIGFDQNDLEKYVSNTRLKNINHHHTDAHAHAIFTVQKEGTYVPTSISPRHLYASIELSPSMGETEVNTPFDLNLSILNRGDTVWLGSEHKSHGAVRIGAHLYDSKRSLIKADYFEIILPQSVNPGEAIQMTCSIPSIIEPGDYILEFDPLIVGLLWFKDYVYNAKDWKYTVRGIADSDQKEKVTQDLTSPILIMPSKWNEVIMPITWNEVQAKKDHSGLVLAAVRVLRRDGVIPLLRKTFSYISRKIRS